MKIGFFSYSLSGVGPRTRARTLIDRLATETDHRIVLVTGPDEDYDHPRIDRHWISRPPVGALTGIRTVREVFSDVDVVHIPINLYQVLYVRLAYHGPLVAGAGLQHNIHYRTAAKTLGIDHVIETHEYVSYLWEMSGYDATPIYPSIDRDIFYPYDADEREAIRRNLNIDPNQSALLYVGALSEFKGAHLFADLVDRFGDDVVGIVAGSGDEAIRFQGREDIRYQGYVDNAELPPLYNAADLTVVPTESESFSLVSLESIACGTPVVTTVEHGPMIRLFQERGTYVWTDDRTVDSLHETVRDLMHDPVAYKQQVECGFDTIADMGLTISDTIGAHLEAYQNAVDSR